MLKALRSLFASTPENGFITYLNNSSSPYCSPSMGGSVGDRLEFSFILDKSWGQLYTRDKSESHKIAGVSDLLGNNSLRLGVRRKPKLVVDGLVAVMYLHKNGVTTYDPIYKLGSYTALILNYDKEYSCRIWLDPIIENKWHIQVYEGLVLIGESAAIVSISSLFRRLSGIYIEPAIYSITTYLKIIRR
jgi:hypothetical protein